MNPLSSFKYSNIIEMSVIDIEIDIDIEIEIEIENLLFPETRMPEP